MSIFQNKTSNNALGGSDLSVYVTDPITKYVNEVAEGIDEAIQGALDKIVDESGGISYQPKPLNEISTERPNTNHINMNNYRIENLATIPDISSIESIIQTPNTAVNVNTMSTYTTLSLALNTAYCGPLLSTMDVKNKRITNLADAQIPALNDPQLENKLKQGVNIATLNQLSLTTAPEDRQNYYANEYKIYELGNPLFYQQSDIQTLPDPLEQNQFNVDPALLEKYKRQAVNVDSVQNNCVTLNVIDRLNFDSLAKQIKNGKQATEAKDYVTLDQVVHEEIKNIEYVEGVVQQKKYVYENDRIIMVSNPKAPVGGQFIVQGSNPPSLISEEKQVVNVGYMREKCRLKNFDINLEETYRVRELMNPSEETEAVNKRYCDSNSGKNNGSGGGNIFTAIFGAIAGAIAGGIAGIIAAFSAQGLGAAVGSVASAGAAAVGSFAANGLFQGGMRTGSSANLEGLKANNPIPGQEQLINNLKDDIANRPEGQPDVGNLISGPSLFDSLVRFSRNAQIGLFDAF